MNPNEAKTPSELLEQLRSGDHEQVSEAIKELRKDRLGLMGLLRGINLQGIRITHGDLRNIDFEHTNLIRSSFSSADMRGTSLIGADLGSAYLSHVNLAGARLEKTDFSHAQLRSVSLDEADLQDANLGNVVLIESTVIKAKLTRVNLVEANLRGTDFSQADLSDADLSHANLRGVRFVGTKLSNTNFAGAKCHHTTFADVDLSIARGLETVQHSGPSTIGIDTLYRSKGKIPEEFLLGSGLSRSFLSLVQNTLGLSIAPVLISYGEAEKTLGIGLQESLIEIDVPCWLLYHPDDQIRQELSSSWQNIIFCCSRSSHNSQWLRYEIMSAMNAEKNIVLVGLDDILQTQEWMDSIDERIKNLATIDFTSMSLKERPLDILAEKIKTALSEQS